MHGEDDKHEQNSGWQAWSNETAQNI